MVQNISLFHYNEFRVNFYTFIIIIFYMLYVLIHTLIYEFFIFPIVKSFCNYNQNTELRPHLNSIYWILRLYFWRHSWFIWTVFHDLFYFYYYSDAIIAQSKRFLPYIKMTSVPFCKMISVWPRCSNQICNKHG